MKRKTIQWFLESQKQKKGTCQTNSSYFLHEIEELLEQADLNERFGWLFKENSNLEIEQKDKILEHCN